MDRIVKGPVKFKVPRASKPSLPAVSNPSAAKKTKAEQGREERFRRAMKEGDVRERRKRFNDRLARLPDHNDIPNV